VSAYINNFSLTWKFVGNFGLLKKNLKIIFLDFDHDFENEIRNKLHI